MTISTDTVWEVESGASDDNGGGFVSSASGTDRSQQTSAHATLTAASLVNATTTIIDVDSGDYTCLDADIGNILQITGGTATAGFYEITARSSQQWTLDRSAGTVGQTVVGAMGGAFATPGQLTNIPAVRSIAHIKAATYTLTTSTPGKIGPVDIPNASIRVFGYSATRGDFAGRPVLDAGAVTSITSIFGFLGNVETQIHHIKVDGQDGSGNGGFLTGGARAGIYDCVALDCPGDGFSGFHASSCQADGCGVGFQSCFCSGCVSQDGTTGFNNSDVFNCIADSNSGTGFLQASTVLANCSSYNNGSDGVTVTRAQVITNCISTDNGGFGFNLINEESSLVKCATFNNTSGRTDVTLGQQDIDAITLSGDPFTDAANDDFSLNNTAGAGADCRAVGLVPFGQTSFGDVGAVQHDASVGGGGAAADPVAVGGQTNIVRKAELLVY